MRFRDFVTIKIKLQSSKQPLVTSLKTSLLPLKCLPAQQDKHMQIPSYYTALAHTMPLTIALVESNC